MIGTILRGHWVTIYLQTYGYELMWWNHRYVFMSTHFIPPLIFFQVYSAHSDFLNTTQRDLTFNETIFGFPTDDGLTFVPITLNPIVSSWQFNFCFNTLRADAVLGWNLFVAAMTPNDALRSSLITRIHNRASLFGSQRMGIFPLCYTMNGSDVSGLAK
jgi:hypothetical protein